MTKPKLNHELALAAAFASLEDFQVQVQDVAAGPLTWSTGAKGFVKDECLYIAKGFAEEAGLTPEIVEALQTGGLLQVGRPRLHLERTVAYMVPMNRLAEHIKLNAAGNHKQAAVERELVGLKKTVQLLSAEADISRKADAFYQGLEKEARRLLAVQGQKQVKPRFADPKRSEKKLAGVPTLFLSDWHFDEVVDPRQIEGKNEYNHDIAVARAAQLFETTGKLLFTHMSGAYYDGLVVAIGGDMLSGMIHEELRRTNANPISVSIMELTTLLSKHIRQLAAEFPDVYVPCVVGNHGRMDKKPQAKGYVKDNFEYLVFVMLKAMLADCPNVQVDVSESFDIRYKIYGWRYRMTHGNQAKGGSGVGGFWPSLAKLDMRKRKLEGDFDYLILGHFHQRGRMSNMIVNGSLKGYDEYALFNAFDYQPAEQSLWITHPEHGITFEMPVVVQEPRYERTYGAAISPATSATYEGA